MSEENAGSAKIKFLGGPEVMSSREQVDALQSGIVQIALIPPSYYAKKVPVISGKLLSNFFDGGKTEKRLLRYPGGTYRKS